MNRKDRRKLGTTKTKADKTYNMKPSAIHDNVKKELEKQRDAIITEAAASSIAATLLVLHDEFGFGKKRIQRFMTMYNDMFDSILKDYISFEDVKTELLKLGVNMTIEKEG